MIENKSISLIDTLYVEFHSRYMEKDQAEKARKREILILGSLNELPDFKVRLWH
jgi:hypothetical protein